MSYWLALAVGAGLAFFLFKSRWNYLRLPVLPRTGERQGVDFAVVIPARNEQATIAQVVKSLPRARVFVVDDHSEDSTAAQARKAGARVIPAPPLPDGALGKPHACWTGAQACQSDWLLFVDADTCYQREFLGALLSYAAGEQLDMLSVFLRQHCETLAGKALLPYSFALYFCGVNGRRVNSPRSSQALSSGHCLLFRREAYLRIGGHAAVLDSMAGDTALAALAKQAGLRARVVRGEHLGRAHMAGGLRAIWRSTHKNTFRFLLANPWGGLQVVVASVLAIALVPVMLWLGAEGHFWASAATLLLPVALLRPWYGSWPRALLAPAAICVFQLMALTGVFSAALGRKVWWKGRRV